MKVKLVRIDQDHLVDKNGYVQKVKNGYTTITGYKPGEYYWVVNHESDPENLWHVVSPLLHKKKYYTDARWTPGAILKEDATEASAIKLVWELLHIGCAKWETLKLSADNYVRTEAKKKQDKQDRLNRKVALFAESQRNYEAALASLGEDGKQYL
jgi:hypothetical protein